MTCGFKARLAALLARWPDKFNVMPDGKVYHVLTQKRKRHLTYNEPISVCEILYTLKIQAKHLYFRKKPTKGGKRNSANKEFEKFKGKLAAKDCKGEQQAIDRHFRRITRAGSHLVGCWFSAF